MYGDIDVMRRRAAQLREQGADIRMTADRLVSQTEAIAWTGRAADAMRERIRDRASHLRDVAGQHESAAESLERHLLEVDTRKDAIAQRQRRAESLVHDAADRIAAVESARTPDGVRREAAPADRALARFTPPPAGHKDWLTVELPGL